MNQKFGYSQGLWSLKVTKCRISTNSSKTKTQNIPKVLSSLKTFFTFLLLINRQNFMKQLFYFIKMRFFGKYLLNPGCKHSISDINFVEASILDKSDPMHDGKTQVFSRGRVPLHQFFSFYISLRPC